MQLSYWEKNSFFNNPDVVIIGSGIVGLHAAIYLKEKNPSIKVLLIEKGFLPYGASTRNAGFACFGSTGELLDDLTKMSEDEVFSLVEKRFKGLQKLRKGLGDKNIDYEPLGGFEVFSENEKSIFKNCADKLSYLNLKLKEITGYEDTYSVANEIIQMNNLQGFQYCIKNKCEGQIDTGKMMHSLLQKAGKLDVTILNGIGIKQVNETATGIEIETNQSFSFHAKHVLITTNGFAKQLLPELDVQPARAQVLITAPIPGLKLKGSFHYDKGFYYFRNVGDRILFGGGRNLDFKTEQTDSFGLTELVQNKLDTMLKEMIQPGISYKIEQRWSGIMGLGSSKTTIVKHVSPRISCAVRMGGMGIAIGSLVGEEGAELVLES